MQYKKIIFYNSTHIGWGLALEKDENGTNVWKQTKTLKLKTLQVSPKDLCEKRFDKEAAKKLGISFRIIQRQLRKGFTNDIACVGNDWRAVVSMNLL